MHYAILYLDPTRRIKLFNDGGYNLEKHIPEIGWCLEEDDTVWTDEKEAMKELLALLIKHTSPPEPKREYCVCITYGTLNGYKTAYLCKIQSSYKHWNDDIKKAKLLTEEEAITIAKEEDGEVIKIC